MTVREEKGDGNMIYCSMEITVIKIQIKIVQRMSKSVAKKRERKKRWVCLLFALLRLLLLLLFYDVDGDFMKETLPILKCLCCCALPLHDLEKGRRDLTFGRFLDS